MFIDNRINRRNRIMTGIVGLASLFLLLIGLQKYKRRNKRRWQVRPINQGPYIQKGQYEYFLRMKEGDPEQFFIYTRMDITLYNELLKKLTPRLLKRHRRALPVDMKLAITLQYLSQGTSFVKEGWGFNVGKSTVAQVVIEVCDAIILELMAEFMPVPSTEEWEKIAQGYEQRWNMPNCIGSVDGKHIVMQAPKKTGSLYYNYKGRTPRNANTNVIQMDYTGGALPRFAERVPNVTVAVGKDALLACVVDELKGFKVAWVRVDTQTILTIHHNVITQNPRITLSHNDHRSWFLHIRNVVESDRGWYMCQINTDPMRSRQGYLQVVVPPMIIDKETSSDMVVRESTNITLVCKAAGYPEPYVMWRREDGENFNYNGENVNAVDGEVLHFTRVSRLHMGAYLCIASNGVPPSVSKRVSLKVQFPPMLSIPNQLEGAYLGQDISLECNTEAYPTSINYWTTEKGEMIFSGTTGEKYETIAVDNGYNKYMTLKIRSVDTTDFVSYKCVAKNSLGETDGIIKLDEIPAPSTTPSSTTTSHSASHRKKGKPWRERGHADNQVIGEEWRDTKPGEEDYTLPSAGSPAEAYNKSLRRTSSPFLVLVAVPIFFWSHR